MRTKIFTDQCELNYEFLALSNGSPPLVTDVDEDNDCESNFNLLLVKYRKYSAKISVVYGVNKEKHTFHPIKNKKENVYQIPNDDYYHEVSLFYLLSF